MITKKSHAIKSINQKLSKKEKHFRTASNAKLYA